MPVCLRRESVVTRNSVTCEREEAHLVRALLRSRDSYVE
jgi:hypothetical protein